MGSRLLQGVNDYPHRALAHGVTRFFCQQTLRAANLVQRDMMGFLPGGNQVFAAVIDIEAARLGFGRLEAFNGDNAAIFRHAEDGQGAGGTIAGIEMTAIRRDMDIRCPAGITELWRHHIHGLHALGLAVRIAKLPDIDAAVEFVNAVGETLIRVEGHMARACALDGGHFRRLLRGQRARFTEGKETDAILLQSRDKQRAVVRGNIGRVAPFQPLCKMDGLARNTIVEAHHADAARIVGGTKQETTAVIGGDMGRAAGERCFCGVAQGAILRGDTVRENAKFRANANVEVTFIRADNHRLHLAWHIDNLHQRQAAFGIQTPDVDLLTFGAGGINGLFHEHSFPQILLCVK